MILMLQVFHPIFSDANVVQVAAGRVTHVWEWYLVRAAGFLAAGLLMLLMVSGIGLVTGLTFRFFEPTKAWVIHKALAFALLASIAVHVIFILLDKYVTFTIPQVLVPFLSKYKPFKLFNTSIGLWVALGILAMYGTIIIVLTSLGYVNWIEKKKKLWKLIHYLGYVVMFFVFLHALYSGTDLAHGPLRALWLLIGAILLLAVASRLLRAGTLKAKNAEVTQRNKTGQ